MTKDVIGICTPTAGQVQVPHMMSILRVFGLLQHPDTPFLGHYFIEVGSVIHQNRERLVDKALDNNCSHILFVDDDMSFAPEALLKLYERNLDIVIGNYPQRNAMPLKPTTLGMDGTVGYPIFTDETTSGIQECFTGGFGLALIRSEVFKKLKKPWFLPYYSEVNNKYSTEDTPFYRAAREAGYKVYVDHDASKLLSHHVVTALNWSLLNVPEEEKNG